MITAGAKKAAMAIMQEVEQVSALAGGPRFAFEEFIESCAKTISRETADGELLEALELAEATIVRLDRHAPGAQQGTLDVVRNAIQRAKGEL